MPFPASLATKHVTASFSTYPGSAATGSVSFTNANWLISPGDNEIISPFTVEVSLDADGDIDVELPATNDPQWSPSGWGYTVTINVGGGSLTGSVELPYDGGDVDLADVFNPIAPAAGEAYILQAARSVPGGVAGLDVDGDVIDADGNKVTGGGGGGSTAWADITGKPSTFAPSAHAASHGSAGTDAISINGSQVTAGTVAVGRLPTGTTNTTVALGDAPAAAVSAHVGLADPHTQYALESDVTTSLGLKANLASPTFTGTPSLPTGTTGVTQSAGNSSTALATTAFVTTADNLKAPLASPTFTGTPAAPTAAAGTNTTQVATTAFVGTAINNRILYLGTGVAVPGGTPANTIIVRPA